MSTVFLFQQKFCVMIFLTEITKTDRHSLEPFSVLINAMDHFYPDDKLDLLVDLFREGKNFIHLCATPFTINLRNGRTNLRALRSFGIVDDMRMAV